MERICKQGDPNYGVCIKAAGVFERALDGVLDPRKGQQQQQQQEAGVISQAGGGGGNDGDGMQGGGIATAAVAATTTIIEGVGGGVRGRGRFLVEGGF